MARLLIVSRSMALAMRLADQHEGVEHPVDELDGLLPHLDADVLVLDVGDPVIAVNTVNVLREAEQVIPVLLVSGYQPEWEQVEAQQVDGVHVVPLPITRLALLHGIAELTGEAAPVDFIDTGAIDLSGRGPLGAVTPVETDLDAQPAGTDRKDADERSADSTDRTAHSPDDEPDEPDDTDDSTDDDGTSTEPAAAGRPPWVDSPAASPAPAP